MYRKELTDFQLYKKKPLGPAAQYLEHKMLCKYNNIIVSEMFEYINKKLIKWSFFLGL